MTDAPRYTGSTGLAKSIAPDRIDHFDLQLFAITGNGTQGIPASVVGVLEQQNFLETKLRRGMKPKYVFRTSVLQRSIEWFEGRIGETKTFTRSAEIPPNITPLNPANNSGLDNGISLDTRSFEQWRAVLYEWAGGINRNILGTEALLADLYLDDVEKEGTKAANSLELICASRLMQAYDTGDTFVNLAASGGVTSIHVDNVYGFDTQYSQGGALGLPTVTSAGNKIPILIISGTTGLVTFSTNCQGVIADGLNGSYMQSGPLVCGASGLLSLDSAVGPLAKGDRVVAIDTSIPSALQAAGAAFNPIYKDGSYVVRPVTGGLPITTAYQMNSGSLLSPSIMIPAAVSIMKRRNIPRLANGLYGCAIDATLLSQLYQDPGFIQATATRWDSSPVFANGQVAAGWGVEFTDATQLPVYVAPQGGFALRHAFVFGEDVISEHPFAAARNAQTRAASVGDMFDFRWVDRIEFVTQAALDRLGEVLKISYKYVGDFEAGTDKGSTPQIVLTTDYCRFKRGVLVQAATIY